MVKRQSSAGTIKAIDRKLRADPSPNGQLAADLAQVLALDGTDLAHGRRFVADHRADARYVADMSLWLTWDGRRWQADRSETRIESLAKATAIKLGHEAAAEVAKAAQAEADAGDDGGAAKKKLMDALKKLQDAKRLQDMRTLRRMLSAARSEPEVCVPVAADVFDRRPHLLNCPNGTVDLMSGELREHRREDFLTRMCPTMYDPQVMRGTYLSFLGKVFRGREAVAEYVRQFSGCVVTGETIDHTAHLFWGGGSNGKSVLVNTWTRVLGEYAHTAPPELLMRDDRGGRHPTEKTGLRGARLAVCAETAEDAALDEAKLKSLASSDSITARYMRADFFSFLPTHKLVISTNHRPRVKGTDHGVWRRLRLVPFTVKFWKDADRDADPAGTFDPEFQADPGLEDRLAADHAEAVLADMVEHAVLFYRAGRTLAPPAEVTAATAEYRKAEDVIAQYFDARVRPDPEGKVKGAAFYKAFQAWWESEGYGSKPPGPRKFGQAAAARFDQVKASSVFYRVRFETAGAWEDGAQIPG